MTIDVLGRRAWQSCFSSPATACINPSFGCAVCSKSAPLRRTLNQCIHKCTHTHTASPWSILIYFGRTPKTKTNEKSASLHPCPSILSGSQYWRTRLLVVQLMRSLYTFFSLHLCQPLSRIRFQSTTNNGIIFDLVIGNLARGEESTAGDDEAEAQADHHSSLESEAPV